MCRCSPRPVETRITSTTRRKEEGLVGGRGRQENPIKHLLAWIERLLHGKYARTVFIHESSVFYAKRLNKK